VKVYATKQSRSLDHLLSHLVVVYRSEGVAAHTAAREPRPDARLVESEGGGYGST
jgi:hypothetical protein